MIDLNDAFLQAFHVFLFGALPVLAVVALAGTVISALQSATSIREPSLGYAVRILAFAALAYAIFPRLTNSLIALTEQLYR